MAGLGKGNTCLFMLLIYIYLIILEISQVKACEPTTTPKMKRTTTTKTTEDSELQVFEKFQQLKSEFTTAHIEVLIALTGPLLSKIKLYWHEKTWVEESQRSQISDITEGLLDTIDWYVRRFITSVNEKFQENFENPRINFHIENIRYDDKMPYIDAPSTTFKLKNNSEIHSHYDEDSNIESDVVIIVLHAETDRGKDDHPKENERVCMTDFYDPLQVFDNNKRQSVIVVEDSGQFSGVRSAAHDMGHMLGADDDGVRGGMSCKSADGFIMTSKETTVGTKNIFKWSSCSIESIKSYIGSADCLNRTISQKSEAQPLTSGAWLYQTTAWATPSLDEQCDQYEKGCSYI